MKVITHVYGPVTQSMAKVANIDDDKVYWDSDKYVEYKREGNTIIIEEVHLATGQWESFHSFDSFNDITMPYKRMIAAACIVLNVGTVIVGQDMVNFVEGAEEITLDRTSNVKPLTDQPYAISGHRKEEGVTAEAEVSFQLPKIEFHGKGKWLAVGCVAALAIAAIAVSRN